MSNMSQWGQFADIELNTLIKSNSKFHKPYSYVPPFYSIDEEHGYDDMEYDNIVRQTSHEIIFPTHGPRELYNRPIITTIGCLIYYLFNILWR